MSNTGNKTILTLNDCGCCEGRTAQTPVTLNNRPGLSAIAYRAGDHGRFRQSLLARLSSSDYPGLADLTTRDDDDFSIALLDAWASVADVLTFYQERLASESYLRTATERLSLLELARLIAYRLAPGVAANTYLAFTMEEAPGDPEKATKKTIIPTGTKVQSTPGPGENAQTYETIEEIEAYVKHNAIRPRLTRPQNLSENVPSIWITGTMSNIKPGDRILIVLGPAAPERIVKTVIKVTVDQERQTTRMDFLEKPGKEFTKSPAQIPHGHISDLPSSYAFPGGKEIQTHSWQQNDIKAQADIQSRKSTDLYSYIKEQRNQIIADNPDEVYVFRQRASMFGYNAHEGKVVYNLFWSPKLDSWELDGESKNKVFLDRVYDQVIPGGYASIHIPGTSLMVFSISAVETRTRTAYGISGQTTLLTFGAGEKWLNVDEFKEVGHDIRSVNSAGMKKSKNDDKEPLFSKIRNTTIHVQSEPLELAEVPIYRAISGDEIFLDDFYESLYVGQPIILLGELHDKPGVKNSEVMELAEVKLEGGFTKLRFRTGLEHEYKRDSVVIHANVAAATHGESAHEILGSGDAGKAHQRFALRQKPLTHLSSASAGGTESTLEVRVNDLLWEEVETFYGRGPNEHIYITKTDDNGNTFIQFGDGKNGARLPTGENNVRARYRKGIGLEGMVKAKQLNLLMTRPLGVREAVNPVAASGADDPESRDDARANAPLTVLTLDRAVSLRDYEDFSRSFAGIAKAQAIRTWVGQTQRVFITVSAPKGGAVEPGSSTYENLSGALQKAGDPYVSFAVQSYRKAFFRVEGGLYLDPHYLPEKVLNEVKDRLREHFSFEQRNFGQPVMLSEVIALIQSVSGVVAVDLDRLYRFGDEPALSDRLIAGPAGQAENNEMVAAELLTLDPSPLDAIKVLS